MNTSHFINVSAKSLVFPKHREAMHAIRIEQKISITPNLKIVHNLPECFTAHVSEQPFRPPAIVRVTYTPPDKQQRSQMPTGPFKLLITDEVQKDTPSYPVVVTVDLVDPRSMKTSNFSDLECKLCLLEYSEENELLTPRVLTACGHTICQNCAETLMKVRDGNREIQCPFDRCLTKEQPKKLPVNRTIIDMLRELTVDERPKSPVSADPDVPCFENSEHEAVCYCTTCKEDYCQDCFETTHSAKILSNHRPIKLSDKPYEYPHCQTHPKNIVKFVCYNRDPKTEQTLFCTECPMTFKHKTHQYRTIEDMLHRNQHDLNVLIEKLNKAENDQMLKQNKAQDCLKTFEPTDKEYIAKQDAITKFYEERKAESMKLLREFSEWESKNLKEVINDYQKDIQILNDRKSAIVNMLKKKERLLVDIVALKITTNQLIDNQAAKEKPKPLPLSIFNVVDGKFFRNDRPIAKAARRSSPLREVQAEPVV